MTSRSATYFDDTPGWRLATQMVIIKATRELVLYDRDTALFNLEDHATFQALKALCLRTISKGCLRLLVHDATFIEQKSTRLLTLCAHFGHRLSIRVIRDEAVDDLPPFIISDKRNLATRFHHDSLRGKLCQDHSAECTDYLDKFDTLWQRGSPGPSGLPLGI